MKKFELVKDDTIRVFGRTLYRIKACKDFTAITGHGVQVGELGGYVEKESNLSQERTCWIADEAKIYGDAKICGNAETVLQRFSETRIMK